MQQFDPAAATRMIESEKLTIWGSVPSVFAMQMATPEYQTTDFSLLQLIIWEGAAMPGEPGEPGEVKTGALETWFRERLANYKIPKQIIVEPDMLLFPIGKIDKLTLKNAR